MTTNDDDRRAAAEVVYDDMKGGMTWFHAKDQRDRIIAGKWDHHPTVQAFTAHRIAAERRGIERAAQACENERLSEPPDEADAAYDHAIDRCIDAIRSLTEGTDK